MPTAFEELENSPRVHVTQQGTTAKRLFKVAWADWQAFARELIGRYKVVGDKWVFQKPIAFPGLKNLLVSELEIEPFDPGGPDGDGVSSLKSAPNRYTAGGALLTATYATAFDADNQSRADLPIVPDGTYLTFKAELSAEYFTTPGRVWRWLDPPDHPKVPPDINPGLLLPQGSFTLTWHRVPLPPWSTIRALRGKVNAAGFLGSPAGTVLFIGARAAREFQFIEDGGFWEVQYAFLENTKELSTAAKVGWNYLYNEEKVGTEHWVAIRDEDGNSPYAGADFSLLFSFG